MTTVVQKWGNSLGLRIPANLAGRLKLAPGSRVELVEKPEGILVLAESEPTLADLLAQIKPGDRPEPIDWGTPKGKEMW